MQNLLCDSRSSSFYNGVAGVVVSVVACSVVGGAAVAGAAVTWRQQKLQPEALSGQLLNW